VKLECQKKNGKIIPPQKVKGKEGGGGEKLREVEGFTGEGARSLNPCAREHSSWAGSGVQTFLIGRKGNSVEVPTFLLGAPRWRCCGVEGHKTGGICDAKIGNLREGGGMTTGEFGQDGGGDSAGNGGKAKHPE